MEKSAHAVYFIRFCSLFSGWPAGLVVKRAGLRGESQRAWFILFLVTFQFQVNYVFYSR